MKPASEHARGAFKLARHAHEPPAGAKTRNRTRLQARIAAGAAIGMGTVVAKTSIASVLGAVGKGPLIGLLLAGAAGFGYGVGTLIDSPRESVSARPDHGKSSQHTAASRSSRVDDAAQPERAAPAMSAVSAGPEREVERNAPAARRVVADAPVSSPARGTAVTLPVTDLAAETHLIRKAHQAMLAGQPTHAHSILDEHARRFPTGVLAEERVATQIIAECKLGHVGDARTRFDRFTAAWPQSPHLARVRAACDLPVGREEK